MKRSRKFIAVTAAACMTLGTAVTPALAAEASGSLTEVLRAQMAKQLEVMGADYAEGYAQFEQPFSVSADISLVPGMAAANLVQAFGIDISWLKNIKLTMDESVVDPDLYAKFSAVLNDNVVLSGEELYSLAEQVVRMRFPELSDQAISANMEETIDYLSKAAEQAAAEYDTSETGDDAISQYVDEGTVEEAAASISMLKLLTQFHSMKDIQALAPTPEQFESIVSRYMNIMLDHITDLSAEADKVEVGEVSVDATAYSGTMDAEAFAAYTKELLDTIKTDEDLLPYVEKLLSFTDQVSYDEFVAGLEEASTELAEMTPADMGLGEGSIFDLVVWTDANGEFIGEYESMNMNGESFEMSFMAPSDGVKSALDVELSLPEGMTDSGITSIVLAGSGDVVNGATTGDYVLTVQGQDVAAFHAEDIVYDEAARSCSGNITASIIAPEDTEDYQLAMISQFTLGINYGMDKENAAVDLTLGMGGMDIATLTLSAAETIGSAGEIPAADTFEPSVNALDQEAVNQLVGSIDPNVILGNLISAGMPAEFIQQIGSLMGGSDAAADVASPAASDSVASVAEPAADEVASVAEPAA